jgi:hypothetical protein
MVDRRRRVPRCSTTVRGPRSPANRRRFQAEEFEIDELASFREVRGRFRLQAKGRDARSPERSVELHYPLLVHPHPVRNDSPHSSSGEIEIDLTFKPRAQTPVFRSVASCFASSLSEDRTLPFPAST